MTPVHVYVKPSSVEGHFTLISRDIPEYEIFRARVRLRGWSSAHDGPIYCSLADLADVVLKARGISPYEIFGVEAAEVSAVQFRTAQVTI